ncbi:hypothetical protein CWI42_011360 [Ordospora colligata]|nr:hypothetical protein CWI42_011360 [Ordospora colligata]
MHKACEFTETNETVTLMISKEDVSGMTISPYIDGSRRLVLCDDLAINLLGDVSPEVTLCTSGPRIEVHLRKVQYKMWIECTGNTTGDVSKTEIENWESEEESEQTESLLDLLSKIYKRSGDDVRRAMEKSFYESEGTVLSTDWDQVKQKKVAREE